MMFVLEKPAIRLRVIALVATLCFVATACGSRHSPAAEVSIGTRAPTTTTEPAAALALSEVELGDGLKPLDQQQPVVKPLPDGESGRNGTHYGASLEEFTAAAGDSESSVANDYPEGYDEVTWEELVPPGFSADEIFARYEDRLDAIPNGSPEVNEIYEEMQAEFDSGADVVNDALDGAKVNLAGFVAPLTYVDETVTEFLLVPYFGACIHVPPPPPNQTVLVTVDPEDGLTVEETWGAVWVAGTLSLESSSTDLAETSYSFTAATVGVYEDVS